MFFIGLVVFRFLVRLSITFQRRGLCAPLSVFLNPYRGAQFWEFGVMAAHKTLVLVAKVRVL